MKSSPDVEAKLAELGTKTSELNAALAGTGALSWEALKISNGIPKSMTKNPFLASIASDSQRPIIGSKIEHGDPEIIGATVVDNFVIPASIHHVNLMLGLYDAVPDEISCTKASNPEFVWVNRLKLANKNNHE